MSDQNSTGGYGSQDPYSGSSGDPWSSGSTNQDSGQQWSSGTADGGPAGSASYIDPYASQGPAASTYDAPQFGQGALPYGGPPQPVYVAAAPTNPLAVTSMILGIVSIVCLPIVAPVGLVLAILGMKQTATSGEQGRGMAIAGLVLSILGILYLLVIVLYLVFVIIFGIAASSSGY